MAGVIIKPLDDMCDSTCLYFKRRYAYTTAERGVMTIGIETEVIEFKKSTGELKEAMYSICAMLNKHHRGEVYFGVKPDGTPIGQMVSEETLRQVSHRISESILPRIYPEIKKVILDGKECIHVRFEGNQVPYFALGVAKIRVTDEDITMSPEQITALLLNSGREGNRWEMLVSNKSVGDVDEELLKRYTDKARDAGRIAIAYSDKETVLNQLELTAGNKLLNAGKALFSDDIMQDVQLAIFATTERLTFNDIQRYHGPVLRLIDIAETYIKSNIHWRVEFTGELERKEIPEIPIDAIREALLNSFCHKDYASGESNEVAIYKDRVEIYNPGAFPDGYDPQYFIEQPSRPIRRNPMIARMLYYSKDIESFGTGLKRIADVCQDANVKYEFKKLKDGFVVCFYRSSYQLKESTGKVRVSTGKVRVNDVDLNEPQKRILQYVIENHSITNREVCNLLNIKDSRAYKVLKEMNDKGILYKEGSFRDSCYRIAEDSHSYHV